MLSLNSLNKLAGINQIGSLKCDRVYLVIFHVLSPLQKLFLRASLPAGKVREIHWNLGNVPSGVTENPNSAPGCKTIAS